jgi:hypothetical protein
MAVRAYAGSARPIDSRFENDPAYRKVEVDATDASLDRGYQRISDNVLFSLATMVVSPARQVVLDAANSAKAASDAQIATFRQSVRDLAQAVKDSGGLTVAQRLTLLSQLSVKLARVADGVLADL